MCDFCNLTEKSFFGLRGSQERGYGYSPKVFILKGNYNNIIRLCAYGEDNTEFEINFCPKCGRELEDEI